MWLDESKNVERKKVRGHILFGSDRLGERCYITTSFVYKTICPAHVRSRPKNRDCFFNKHNSKKNYHFARQCNNYSILKQRASYIALKHRKNHLVANGTNITSSSKCSAPSVHWLSLELIQRTIQPLEPSNSHLLIACLPIRHSVSSSHATYVFIHNWSRLHFFP